MLCCMVQAQAVVLNASEAEHHLAKVNTTLTRQLSEVQHQLVVEHKDVLSRQPSEAVAEQSAQQVSLQLLAAALHGTMSCS